MRKTKEQNGITLIALIITIIVLLILAVVAIGAVQNDGIIDHAKNARDQYGAAQVTENSTIQSYLDKIQQHVATGTGSGENNSGEGGGTKEEPTEPEPPETPIEPETPEPEAPTSITIQGECIEQGLTRTLTAYDQNNNVIPADELEWQSSDESKVTVSNGVATGVEVDGNWVTIRATSKVAPEVYGETFILGVIEPISSIGIMQSDGMELISETSVSVGSTVKVNVCRGNMPGPIEWGCDESIIWESGDSTIASVTNGGIIYGVVTGIKAGTTTITAKHPQRENVTATITITVTE